MPLLLAPRPHHSGPSRQPHQVGSEPVRRATGRVVPRGQRVTAGYRGTGLFLGEQSPPAISSPIVALTPPQPTRVCQCLTLALTVFAGLAMLICAIVAAWR